MKKVAFPVNQVSVRFAEPGCRGTGSAIESCGSATEGSRAVNRLRLQGEGGVRRNGEGGRGRG